MNGCILNSLSKTRLTLIDAEKLFVLAATYLCTFLEVRMQKATPDLRKRRSEFMITLGPL